MLMDQMESLQEFVTELGSEKEPSDRGDVQSQWKASQEANLVAQGLKQKQRQG
jgi:hypothetical protein